MIRDAVHFVQGLQRPSWLIVGKGPSAVHLDSTDLPVTTPVVTLNHACLLDVSRFHLSVAHFVDVEAWRDCAAQLCAARRYVCLPWHPHVKMSPREDCSLANLAEQDSHFRTLLSRGRVLSYNASSAHKLSSHPSVRGVRLRLFSSVGVFNIMADARVVRKVFTLGVDGGTDYASCFDAAHRLANGRASFSEQYPELQQACNRSGMVWVDLGRSRGCVPPLITASNEE